MSDLFEQASDTEEAERIRGIAAAAAGARPRADWEKTSAKWCEGAMCGERIPDDRRRAVANVRLCVDCQHLKERQQGMSKGAAR